MENKINKNVEDAKNTNKLKPQLLNMDENKHKIKGGRDLVYPFMFDCKTVLLLKMKTKLNRKKNKSKT